MASASAAAAGGTAVAALLGAAASGLGSFMSAPSSAASSAASSPGASFSSVVSASRSGGGGRRRSTSRRRAPGGGGGGGRGGGGGGGIGSPSPPPPPGANVLDRQLFELGQVLGRGGYGTVVLARNVRTGALVAIKRFHTDGPAGTLGSAALHAIADKERRIWAGLRHRNVVSYEGCFTGAGGELNLVVEYVDGWSLADHVAQVGAFPEPLVAEVARQLVDGLDYLHSRGVTHRDLKPANVLVTRTDGTLKITDFNVSASTADPTATGATVVGTAHYIAPEMVERRPYTASVDVWSLGCTVLELATGRRPWHDHTAMSALVAMARVRHPPLPPGLSRQCRSFLAACWVWEPARRPSPAHLRRHPFLAKAQPVAPSGGEGDSAGRGGS